MDKSYLISYKSKYMSEIRSIPFNNMEAAFRDFDLKAKTKQFVFLELFEMNGKEGKRIAGIDK